MVELGGDVRGMVAQGQRVAQKLGAGRSTTAHVLMALLQSGTEATHLLLQHGVREVPLYAALRSVPTEASNALELALERAGKVALHSGSRQARPLHLLLALLRDPRCEACRCVQAVGVAIEPLREVLEDSLGTGPVKLATTSDRSMSSRGEAPLRMLPRTSMDWEAQKRTRRAPSATTATTATNAGATTGAATSAPAPEARAQAPASEERPAAEPRALEQPKNSRRPRPRVEVTGLALDPQVFPLLVQLGRNLSELARTGEVDEVVGRDLEIDQTLDILSRRRANNPVLVGPAGVGKTAIVEGLALRLVNSGSELPGFENKVIIELSAGALVGGTGVRGALAERLGKLRKEVRASEGRVLLFLDEIHTIVGGSDGPDDLANELKAALARGELPCIGATTEAEYRRVFEKDAALARRFSRVEVAEPTPAAALEILRGAAPEYEAFHAVEYTDEALSSAVDLSVRYMPDQHLPDKAIGVIDLAAARVRRAGHVLVDRTAVAEVISARARVPLDRLLMRDAERLLSLEQHLSARVVGQPEAIRVLSDALRKSALGLRRERPLGVFLMLGPTGVGKTELAKAVSEQLFPAGALTRLDMSEYGEGHAVSKLFGAPPGYVGHEDGGQLTEAVRRRPYQLVLLDEVDKAHPDVLLSLLPMLDEGRFTDGRGRTVDFRNTVVVMTSNYGANAPRTERRIGFSDPGDATRAARIQQAAIAAARASLPPELFNRIDEVVYCTPLARHDVAEIARRMLAEVIALLRREHGVLLEVDESVVDSLIELGGFDPELGARPMRRLIGRQVESRLAAAILAGEVGSGERVLLTGTAAGIVLVPERAPAAQ